MHKTINLLAVLSCLLVFSSACGLFGGEDKKENGIPGKIVFSMADDTEKENYQIYVMNVDGSGLKQLTHFENDEAVQPSWSPDGKQIVFVTTLRSSSAGGSLYLMNADGTDIRPLKERPNSGIVTPGSNPVWSPDGTKIAYDWCANCELGGGNYEIYIYNFETDSVKKVTDHPAGDSYPTWSPDSQQLAFVSHRDYYDADTLRFRGDIYSINIDGSTPKRLTETGYARNPLWEPNSNKIAYRNSDSTNGLYQVSALTKSIQQIDEPFSEELFLYPISYSPEGKELLLKVRNYPYDSFHLLNLQTGEDISIKFGPEEFIEADWYYNENL